jgi:hypothetical protein
VDYFHLIKLKRLNQKIRVAHPNFYKLVEHLYYESRLLPLHVTLVCQGTLQRRQRTAYSKLQDKVFSYWDGYNNKKMGAFLLLKKCAEIYGHE